MSTDLVDEGARRRIAQSHDETLFVEAGAGSGKTSALVSRVVSLVLSGVSVRRIAAITFTEAAAAELRARVRQTLEDVEAGGDVARVTEGLDDDAQVLARTALDELDDATICTLHSFAQRLLLGAPVEAQLPPRVEVHDDISSALRFDDRWRRFERSLLDDDSLDTVLRASLVLGIDKLEAVAATLGQNWDLVEEADRAGLLEAARQTSVDLTLPVDDWIDRWRAIIDRRVDCVDDSAPLLAWLKERAARLLALLVANRDEPFTLLELTDHGLPSPNRGKAREWQEGAKKEIVALAKDLMDEMTAARAAIVDRVLTRLGAEVGRYTLDDAEARRREGQLEFHDLLVLARRLLRTSPAVRRRYHDRWSHLLIDEFQDTDPLQIEIAVRLAADPDHDVDLPWDRLGVPEGRLFFVGDPKQSIYRFRRADIDLFASTAARYAAGAASLSVNFRSTEPVLAFCNGVFDQLIGPEVRRDDADRISQPAYTPLAPHRPALSPDPGPAVVVLGDEGHASVPEAKRAEANDVAAALARAHAEAWSVSSSGVERSCRWSDMAVLLPSRSTLSQLRSAFESHGVPYRIETGTLIYGTTEIIDLLSALRAIDDPGDGIAVVGALRSSVYGCGDDDLAAWAAAGGRMTYLGEDPPGLAASPVQRALADLRKRHRGAPFQSVPGIVQSVIRDRRLMELALANGGHRDVWRLYRVVVEHARHFADQESGGLRRFLRWVELQGDDKIRAVSPVLPEADVDAVRILTIHASKGLEFGITAVSGLSAQDPNSSRGPTVLFADDGGYEVRMRSGMETTRFEEQRSLEETMDREERIRLLYVGLTRARDHLIVSSHHKVKAKNPPNSHGLRLARCLEDLGTSVDYERWQAPDEASGSSVDPVPFAGPKIEEVERWERDQASWSSARTALLRAEDGVISATRLSALAGEADDEVTAQPEPWRRGRGGTSIGSAVHGVLQYADLAAADREEIAALARWQAMVEGVAEAAGTIEQRAHAAMTSDLVRRAVESGRWRREVHVGATVSTGDGGAANSGVDVEGFVDLLFCTDDGLVAVDYKTDAVRTDADIDRALERHAPQGAAYAVALEAATGQEVIEVHFLFAGDDGAVDAEIQDLSAAKQALRDQLAAVSGSDS